MNIDVSGQVSNAFGKIISWIPEIIGVILILIIGYIIAKAIESLVEAILHRTNINKRMFESRAGHYVKKITNNPAKTIGAIVYWLVWLLVLTIAIPILNIPVLNQIIFGFYSYLPNIIAAILIFLVATAIAAGSGVLVKDLMGDTTTGRVVGTILPSLIMTIAVFMILVQLKIATPIVIITYAALIGALSLGFALAFGLGGREVAGEILSEAYRKGRENIGQIKKDAQTARERGKERIEDLKEE